MQDNKEDSKAHLNDEGRPLCKLDNDYLHLCEPDEFERLPKECRCQRCEQLLRSSFILSNSKQHLLTEISRKAPNQDSWCPVVDLCRRKTEAELTPALKAFANRPNPYFLDVELLNRFLDTLEPMRDKLGPIMFQFEYLNKKKMPSREVFLERLDEFFGRASQGYDYAVETRNKNYLTEDFFRFLRERGLGLVLIEGYYMPHIADITAEYDVRTTEFSIVRLHGPDREGIEERTGGSWNEIVEPKDDGLKTTASIIRENIKRKITTYVNVNNHYEGCAPLTIQRLLRLL